MNHQNLPLGLIQEKLSQIEARLQVIVEGSARRLFPGAQVSQMLAERLLNAVRDGLRLGQDGRVAAPDCLILFVSPSEMDQFQDPRWLEELQAALRAEGSEAGLRFPETPFLQMQVDAALMTGEVRVATQNQPVFLSQTTDMQTEPELADGQAPSGAFLIVDGMRLFPLDQVVVNIGRRPDNHLVIDDARVSRTHAQLRLVNAGYVIFDLDSSGGTWVNGQPVSQKALQPGDVISLSGLPLVYGQESQGLGETQEYVPEA